MRRSTGFLRALVFFTLFLRLTSAYAADAWNVVALTGQTAPGTTLSFKSFEPPVLNDNGDITFLAGIPRLDENGNPISCTGRGCNLTSIGAWYARSGDALQPLVLPWANLPEAPGPVVSASAVAMNDAGSVGVLTQFSTGRGIYQSNGGNLSPVAVSGQVADAEPAVFGSNIRAPVITNTGDLLFSANTVNTVTQATGGGYWVANPERVMRGPPLEDFRFGLGDDGRIGFSRGIIGQPFGYGMYLGDLHAQQLVLRSGEPAPGSSSTFGYPQRPSVNNEGKFVVHVTLGPLSGPAEGTGIWQGDATGISPLVLAGVAAPGTSATFKEFAYSATINDQGTIGFGAILSGSGITTENDESLWKSDDGLMFKVAQEGEFAPGTDAYFDRIGLFSPDSFTFFSEGLTFALNNAGQMAFMAALTGPGVTPSNDSGIWAESTSGELTLLLREGDLIEIAPGDSRQVAGFQFRTGGGAQETYDGGFTDLGFLALQIGFTDGSEAILINRQLAIPEPTVIGLLGSVVWCWPARRIRLAS